MPCKQCASEKRGHFNGEVALHFPGLGGLSKPIVWVFPRVTVCLSCGSAEFEVPQGEVTVLATGVPVPGAVVLRDQLGERKFESRESLPNNGQLPPAANHGETK